MRDVFPVAGREGEVGILALEAECRRQVGNDGDSLEEACHEAADRSGGAHGVGGPAKGTFGKSRALRMKDRQEIAREDGGLSLGGLAQRAQGLLGDTRVLEDDGATRCPEGCLDGGNLGGGDLDQRGECAGDAGLEELRTVEAAQDRLRSLAKSLTLALEL